MAAAGGQFVFDVNTPYKLRRMDGQIYMDETEETCCVWRTFFSQRTQVCTYQVDLFQLRPDGAWERTFEEHRERAWDRRSFAPGWRRPALKRSPSRGI